MKQTEALSMLVWFGLLLAFAICLEENMAQVAAGPMMRTHMEQV